MKQKQIARVKLGDNREIRILRIPTAQGDLIRVGVNLLPGGENMSGAVFPETALPEVIAQLQRIS